MSTLLILLIYTMVRFSENSLNFSLTFKQYLFLELKKLNFFFYCVLLSSLIFNNLFNL